MKKLISILAIFSMLFSSAISCSFAQESAEKDQLTSGGEYSFQTKSIENKKTENSDDEEKIHKLELALIGVTGLTGAAGLGCYGYNKGYEEGSAYTVKEWFSNIVTGAGLVAGGYYIGLPLLGLAKTVVAGAAGGLWTGTKFAAGGAVTLCKLPFKIVGGVVNAAIHPISSISYLFTFFSHKNKLYRKLAEKGITGGAFDTIWNIVSTNRGNTLAEMTEALNDGLIGAAAGKTSLVKEAVKAVFYPGL